MEVMIWDQILSLVDKCWVQMCAYPMVYISVNYEYESFTCMLHKVVFSWHTLN